MKEKENGDEHTRREPARFEKSGRMKYVRPEIFSVERKVGEGDYGDPPGLGGDLPPR